MADSRQLAGCGDDVAIGVVLVGGYHFAITVDDLHYVTLEVCNVVVDYTVVIDGVRLTAGGIEEVEGIASISLPEEFTAGVHIEMLIATNSFACIPAWRVSMPVLACNGLSVLLNDLSA